MKKEEFTVVGVAKTFAYEKTREKVPEFWKEHYAMGNEQYVFGFL